MAGLVGGGGGRSLLWAGISDSGGGSGGKSSFTGLGNGGKESLTSWKTKTK